MQLLPPLGTPEGAFDYILIFVLGSALLLGLVFAGLYFNVVPYFG